MVHIFASFAHLRIQMVSDGSENSRIDVDDDEEDYVSNRRIAQEEAESQR